MLLRSAMASLVISRAVLIWRRSGKIRSVCEGRVCHAELVHSGGHDLGEPGFRASQLFRHYNNGVIRRLGYQAPIISRTIIVWSLFEAKLRRRAPKRAFGYRQFSVERQMFALQRLEHHVQSYHFCEGYRLNPRIRVS